MTKKLVPIDHHKEKDLRLIREKLLNTIKSEYKCETCKGTFKFKNPAAKDITDASKLLARMHKALAPDKTIEKISPEEKKKEQELTDTDKKVIKEALGFN